MVVNFSEKILGERLKAAGGKWDPKEKLWYVPYGPIRGTELEDRIQMDFIKGRRKSSHPI
jgi:hypothetical protein